MNHDDEIRLHHLAEDKKMEHTPTPWEVESGRAIMSEGKEVCHTYSLRGHDNMEADADFIVRACNSHDELLQAAKDAFSCLAKQRVHYQDHSRIHEDVTQALMLAIIKAERD